MDNLKLLKLILEGSNTSERLTADIGHDLQARKRRLDAIRDLALCDYIKPIMQTGRDGRTKIVYAVTDHGLEYIEELEAANVPS